jgi:hypothetical protein
MGKHNGGLSMNNEPLDPDNVQSRELYAHFGRAAFHAQCFEMSLEIILLLYHKLGDPTFTVERWEAMEATLQKKTMGYLLREVQTRMNVVVQGEADVLNQALEKRNYLMHRFWRENIQLTLTTPGRDRLIDELNDIANSFTMADALVSSMYGAMAKMIGMTEEAFEAELHQFHKEAEHLGKRLLEESPEELLK